MLSNSGSLQHTHLHKGGATRLLRRHRSLPRAQLRLRGQCHCLLRSCSLCRRRGRSDCLPESRLLGSWVLGSRRRGDSGSISDRCRGHCCGS
jgi:hypothetical protein